MYCCAAAADVWRRRRRRQWWFGVMFYFGLYFTGIKSLLAVRMAFLAYRKYVVIETPRVHIRLHRRTNWLREIARFDLLTCLMQANIVLYTIDSERPLFLSLVRIRSFCAITHVYIKHLVLAVLPSRRVGVCAYVFFLFVPLPLCVAFTRSTSMLCRCLCLRPFFHCFCCLLVVYISA